MGLWWDVVTWDFGTFTLPLASLPCAARLLEWFLVTHYHAYDVHLNYIFAAFYGHGIAMTITIIVALLEGRASRCRMPCSHAATHDCSTHSRTRRLYSRLFSVKSRAASELAGEFGFGSQSSD